MIEVKNIKFSYGRKKEPILDNFSMKLEQGNIYGLLGKNGAGKSTLLYLMTGLLTPKSGYVEYLGADVRRRLPVTQREIFLVPEEFELPKVSLISFIELNSVFYPHFSKEDMITYLHLFDMDIDLNLGELSMGQKKKVFMSFALATHTSLLLMDEPTNGLDIPGKSQFRKFITAGMNDKHTIVISTHQVKDVDKVLDHVIIMENSKILLNESVSNITDRIVFTESNEKDLPENTIYSTSSLKGNYVVVPNTDNEETDLNLEMLFNATLAHPDKIKLCFAKQQETTSKAERRNDNDDK
jgi:ABC-type multidrug transport system, ATPase component